MIPPFLTALICLLLSSVSAATAVDFDRCVDGLYGEGGVSKLRARQLCVAQVSAEVLACQKMRFLINFEEPEAAFNRCLQSAPLTSSEIPLYRGTYENAPAPSSKKTVCSITVNSTEEREAFRERLDPTLYNWIELLPQNTTGSEGRFIPRDDFWIRRACAAKIKCDILVISGHFASTFLGSSGFEVKLEDLTKYSCDRACAPIFENVDQVYLFGCNTLAEKTPDRRSLSLYRDVLVEDGVSPHQAQRIVARRYTSYGETIRDEIRSVFPNAREIFGFASLGPTGKNVASALKKYLRTAYAPGKSPAELARNFSATLGRHGMTVASGQPKDRLSCQQPRQRILRGSDGSREGLGRFIDAYASELPVPAFDLLDEAVQRNFISESERSELGLRVLNRVQRFPFEGERKRVCPLLLTPNSRYIPAELKCQADLSWL